jgi:hypothetical protein
LATEPPVPLTPQSWWSTGVRATKTECIRSWPGLSYRLSFCAGPALPLSVHWPCVGLSSLACEGLGPSSVSRMPERRRTSSEHRKEPGGQADGLDNGGSSGRASSPSPGSSYLFARIEPPRLECPPHCGAEPAGQDGISVQRHCIGSRQSAFLALKSTVLLA